MVREERGMSIEIVHTGGGGRAVNQGLRGQIALIEMDYLYKLASFIESKQSYH